MMWQTISLDELFNIRANLESSANKPSGFLEQCRKKWWDFILKKQRLSEYLPKVVKNMFINDIFPSLREKWFINH